MQSTNSNKFNGASTELIYLGCPRDVLQEEGQVLPAKRPEHVPEPLDLFVRALEVGVLRVVLLLLAELIPK